MAKIDKTGHRYKICQKSNFAPNDFYYVSFERSWRDLQNERLWVKIDALDAELRQFKDDPKFQKWPFLPFSKCSHRNLWAPNVTKISQIIVLSMYNNYPWSVGWKWDFNELIYVLQNRRNSLFCVVSPTTHSTPVALFST